MASAQATLEVYVTAKDGVTRAFNTMSSTVKRWSSTATKYVGTVLKALTSLRTFFVGFVINKAFRAFQTMMDGPTQRAVNDSWVRFKNSVAGVFSTLADRFAPMLTGALESMAKWVDDNREGIVKFVTDVAEGFKSVAEWIGTATKNIIEFGKQALKFGTGSLTAKDQQKNIDYHTGVIRRAGGNLGELSRFLEAGRAAEVANGSPSFIGPDVLGILRSLGHDIPHVAAKVAENTAATEKNTEVQVKREQSTASGGRMAGFREIAAQWGASTERNSKGGIVDIMAGETSQAFDRARESALQLANTVQQSLSNALFGLASGALKASEAVKQLVSSLIDGLLKDAIDRLTKSLVGGFLGSLAPAGGGAVSKNAMGGRIGTRSTGWVPLQGYASGGPIYSSPHVAMIGEGKHNEAVVPLPDGRSIPVRMSNGGGDTIIYQTIHAIDTQSFAQASARAERETGIHRKMTQNSAKTSPSMRRQFGLRR